MFYKKILIIGLPIILRNTLTSFNGFIDNLMVGELGGTAITATSIINQILFVFICTFLGTNAVIGLYSTQYFGVKDYLGVQKVFFIKVLVSVILVLIFFIFTHIFYDKLILLYVTKGNEILKKNILDLCNEYYFLSLLSLIPLVVTQIFASTINESGNTALTMLLCILASLINAILNYIFINGNLGFPKLGLFGASLATFMSRLIEMVSILIIRKRFIFLKDIFKNIKIDLTLFYTIIKKIPPAYINEFLFSFSVIVTNQIYSIQSVDNIVIMSVTSILTLFFLNFISAIGYSSEILIGHQLGKTNFDTAYQYSKQALQFVFTTSLFLIPAIFILSFYFPKLYNFNQEITENISKCIQAFALNFYLIAIAVVIFYILRSGGRILLISTIDSVFFWLIVIPSQFLLVKYSRLKIFEIYFVTLLLNIIKCTVGIYIIRSKSWMRNLIQ